MHNEPTAARLGSIGVPAIGRYSASMTAQVIRSTFAVLFWEGLPTRYWRDELLIPKKPTLWSGITFTFVVDPLSEVSRRMKWKNIDKTVRALSTTGHRLQPKSLQRQSPAR
jgi:hypothetical protein